MLRALLFSSTSALMMMTLLAVNDAAAQQESTTARPTLHPYTARYNVRYRGISGGDIEATLKSEGNGRYMFRSHLLPNFLGGLFTSDQAEDSSELELTDTGLRPLKFRSEDGSSNTDKDISLDFDWAKGQVQGHANGKDFEMTVPKGTQERLSIQLAASLALQADRDPGTLNMLERDELQQYHITRQGVEHVSTAGGDYDAVVLNSERVGGSSRSTRYWYAEKLGYIVVRAERRSHGKVDIVMELKSVKLE